MPIPSPTTLWKWTECHHNIILYSSYNLWCHHQVVHHHECHPLCISNSSWMCTASNFIAPYVGSSATYTLIFKTCTHAHKSLSNKNNYFSRLWNYKYGCVHDGRESLWHSSLTQCLNRAWFFSQYCLHLLRKPIEDRLAVLAIFSSSMHLLLKNDINKIIKTL